jgi:hypothetical protein
MGTNTSKWCSGDLRAFIGSKHAGVQAGNNVAHLRSHVSSSWWSIGIIFLSSCDHRSHIYTGAVDSDNVLDESQYMEV